MATKNRKKTYTPNPAIEARKAEVELLVTRIDEDEPNFHDFMARWADRYSDANLLRLWVQMPTATQLHMFKGWYRYGRRVKAGAKAIWLKLPRTRRDEDKVTPLNPNGEVFEYAVWTAMYDFSQTVALDEDWTDTAKGADPVALAEVKRLRKVAMALHPDVTGDNSQEACRAFGAAWQRYESAKQTLAA